MRRNNKLALAVVLALSFGLAAITPPAPQPRAPEPKRNKRTHPVSPRKSK